jgi:hypothetical protein
MTDPGRGLDAIHTRLDFIGLPRQENGGTLSATYRIQILADERDRLRWEFDALAVAMDRRGSRLEDAIRLLERSGASPDGWSDGLPPDLRDGIDTFLGRMLAVTGCDNANDRSAHSRVEWRAVGLDRETDADRGDSDRYHGPWCDASEAETQRRELAADDPPYDEVWLERREITITAPGRVQEE